jgi:hypothetical protein
VIGASSVFQNFPEFTKIGQVLSEPHKIASKFKISLSLFHSVNDSLSPRENDYDLIIPNLYVGNEHAAGNADFIEKNGITAIVSFGQNTSNSVSNTFRVDLDDSVFDEFTPEFWKAIDFIQNTLESGGAVLIHCRKGFSRSPSLCVAFLMQKKRYSFEAAMNLVKSKRPAVSINPGFVQQLKSRDCWNRPL